MSEFPSPKLRVALVFYSILWVLGLPLGLFYLWRRSRRDPMYLAHLRERFGVYDVPLRDAVWVHAVSLGEVRSAVPLIEALLAQGEDVVITCFTPAGRREALRVFDRARVQVIWVPFDHAWPLARFLEAYQPQLGLVMEIEIWPGMIMAARRAGVPLFMCNAQYPSKSYARDTSRTPLRAEVMRGFAGAFVKSELQRARFAAVGVDNIAITGELRFDQPLPAGHLAAAVPARAALAQGRAVVTVASAVKGEDAVYLGAIAELRARGNAPLIVYVPRAPERFDEVAAMLVAAGLRVARRSQVLTADLGLTGPVECDVLLGDSMGEMYFYLALADQVVVGGGFLPAGAHNIIEPLALRKPVLVGPSVWTIEYPFVEAEAAGVARIVADAPALAKALAEALADGAAPDQAAIEAFFEAHAGAARRTVAALPDLVAGAL